MNVKPLNQRDPKWANILLGYNTDPKYDIGDFGCLITCLAMTVNYYTGKSETPATINEKLKDSKIKGFANGGYYVFNSLTKIYKDIKERNTKTPYPLTEIQLKEIKDSLDAGYPVMVEVDSIPATAKPDQHFVLFIDYDDKDENNFTIADPWDGTIKSLKTYLYGTKKSVRTTVMQYNIISGTPIKPPESCQTELEEMRQSRNTWKDTAQKQEKVIATNEVEIKNRIEQVERKDILIAQKDEVIKALQDDDNSDNATITALQNHNAELTIDLDNCAKDKGRLALRVAALEMEVEQLKAGMDIKMALDVLSRAVVKFFNQKG